MPALQDRLAAELTAARKAQDKALTLLLGTIIADTRNREIELKRPLTDDDVIEVLRKGVKKRKESVTAYEQAGRTELAAAEAAEVVALERYLPAMASEDEVRDAVRAAVAAGATSVGPVMGAVMPRFKGRADGGMINRVVREELGKAE
ncbi:MAG: GatB/YqeY domain-containing protein [Gemmatimonadetes bacterium]|nr:GatB/YqeY domain-containing protein [Gemmatimonadota bacterium]